MPDPVATTVNDVVPPVEWATVRKIGLTGLALAGGAAALGVVATFAGEVPSLLHTARLLLVFVGAVLAGCYGALHDQISYTISPEYFTKVKFEQFRYADFGCGNRSPKPRAARATPACAAVEP